MTGVVVSWTRSWGVIQPDFADHPNVFVHWTAIQQSGFKRLFKGDVVEFQIKVFRGEPRPRACNVVVVESAV